MQVWQPRVVFNATSFIGVCSTEGPSGWFSLSKKDIKLAHMLILHIYLASL